MRRDLFSKFLRGFAFFVALSPAAAAADGNDALGASFSRTIDGGGIATAGIGLSQRGDGFRDLSGMLALTDVPSGATVMQASLYWVTFAGQDDTILVDGAPLTGTLIGISPNTAWPQNGDLASFRADVTSLVSGNATFLLEGFPSSGALTDTNGAGLVVLYSDPAAMHSSDITIYDGALTWCGAARSQMFTNLVVPDTPSEVLFGLTVTDGQALADPTLMFETITLPTNFAGTDGAMWDRGEWNVTTEVAAGTTDLGWSFGASGDDCLHVVASTLDVRYPNVPTVDMGMPPADMGSADMGGTDLGPADVGPPDAGRLDLGGPDAMPDLSAADLGMPDDGGTDAATPIDMEVAVDMTTIPDTAPPADLGPTEVDPADLGPVDQGRERSEMDGATPDLPGHKPDGCCSTTGRRPWSYAFVLVVLLGLVSSRRRASAAESS